MALSNAEIKARVDAGYWGAAWPYWAAGLVLLVAHFAVWSVLGPWPGFVPEWLGLVSRHWFLFALLALLYLGIGGLLGRGVGALSLFRQQPQECDPDNYRTFNSYPFWTGYGATLLVLEVWIVVGLYQTWMAPDGAAPHPGSVRLPPFATGHLPAALAFLAATAGPFVVLLLVLAAVPSRTADEIEREVDEQPSHLRLYAMGAAVAAFVVVCEFAFLYSFPNGWLTVFGIITLLATCRYPFDKNWGTKGVGIAVFLVSWVPLCLGRSLCLDRVAPVIARLLGRLLSPEHAVPAGLALFLGFRLLTNRNGGLRVVRFGLVAACVGAAFFLAGQPGGAFVKSLLRAPADCYAADALHQTFWIFAGVHLMSALIILMYQTLVPAMCIKALLSWTATGYLVFVLVPDYAQPVLAVALVAGLVWSNSGAYTYRFPHMGRHYESPVPVNVPNPAPEGAPEPGPKAPAAPDPRLWCDRGVLEAWGQRFPGPAKPKLVLIGVSGGAYRASFWVGTVLDELTVRVPSFHRHVRLITGASGGMVAAAYYAKYVNDFEEHDWELATDVVRRFRKETRLDSFRPLVQQLIQHDVPSAFSLRAHQRTDRGLMLERCWPALGGSFPALYKHEERGRCPSVIFSPMLVETGQRLLISNLDLRHLARRADDGRLKESALEFFKTFRDTRDTFRVQTAVRMQATFPYISPAVNLPTAPPLRVVDAGYYDNFGVNLAMAWATEHRDWLREHTSGVAFVQIRAFTRAEPKKDGQAGPKRVDLFAAAARSFQWLTSPPEGGVSALNNAMKYRNDEQIETTRKLFPDNFFRTFVFENDAEFGMNWFLAPQSLKAMRDRIEKGGAASELHQLLEWWNRPAPGA